MLGLSAFAQDTTKTKQHLNEFGIDATGFLKAYLNIGNSQQYPVYYNPTYYLTYRRHFSAGNLRISVGGDFYNNEVAPIYNNDSTIYHNKGNSFYATVGWEFYSNLNKRWQVFYGMDLRTAMVFQKNEQGYTNGGYVEGSDSRTQDYALAPFLGIRFKITKRISILTETSYSINTEKDYNNTFFNPIPGVIQQGPPPVPTNQKLTKVYSLYSQPLEVFIDFTI